jgi:pimeloyl-ACP methyl ester carboxylesterase
MATYVLIPGAGSTAGYWSLVEPLLRERGHDVVAVDLPCDDPKAGLEDYAQAVLDAVGGRKDLILVAQSLGGFTATLVASRLKTDLLVLVAAMVPKPGESAGEWWGATGQAEARREQDVREGRDPDAPFDPFVTFLHDVPQEVIAATAGSVTQQAEGIFVDPLPLDAWPDVPTRFLLCRDDRFFPADFQRRVVRERLGIVPDEIDGGHLPALARPAELVERLERFRTDISPIVH